MWVFLNAALRLSELKALAVLSMSATSVPSSSRIDLMAKITASMADSRPAQSCWQPTALDVTSHVT